MFRTSNTTRLLTTHRQPAIHIPDRAVLAAEEPAALLIQVPGLVVRAVRVALDAVYAAGGARAAGVVDADGVLGAAVEPLAVVVGPLRFGAALDLALGAGAVVAEVEAKGRACVEVVHAEIKRKRKRDKGRELS